MKENSGCCGHPSICAGTTRYGRCKAKEEFEQANGITVKGDAMDGFTADKTREEIAARREKIRKRRERKRNRPRRRGDTGRTMER